jgi:hypothetical protein
MGETSIKRVHRSALTETEIALLDQLVKDKSPLAPQRKTRSHYLTKIARSAGYLARAKIRYRETLSCGAASPPHRYRFGVHIGAKIVSNWKPLRAALFAAGERGRSWSQFMQ